MLTRASSMVVAVSLAAAVFGTGCAASSAEDTGSGEGAQSVPVSTLARTYQGTIGTQKVTARLKVSGNAISGSYFVADKETNGDAIVLSGNAIGTKLTLSETVNGTKTGALDTKIGNGSITGTWTSPNGATSLPVNLTGVKSGTPIVVTRKYKDSAPAAATSSGLKTCESVESYLEVIGLDTAAAEDAINQKLAPLKIERDASGKCDVASTIASTQRATFNAQGFLSIEKTSDSNTGMYEEITTYHLSFKTSDGSELAAKDIFAANASAGVKALVAKSIKADPRFADDRQQALDQLDSEWSALDDLQFGISDAGLLLDLGSSYEHAAKALAPSATLAWADVKPLLKAGSVVLPLAK